MDESLNVRKFIFNIFIDFACTALGVCVQHTCNIVCVKYLYTIQLYCNLKHQFYSDAYHNFLLPKLIFFVYVVKFIIKFVIKMKIKSY